MSIEAIAFVILILLHLRWAVREAAAEKQRDNIRKDLLNTLNQLVEAQNEFRPMIYRITESIARMDRE